MKRLFEELSRFEMLVKDTYSDIVARVVELEEEQYKLQHVMVTLDMTTHVKSSTINEVREMLHRDLAERLGIDVIRGELYKILARFMRCERHIERFIPWGPIEYHEMGLAYNMCKRIDKTLRDTNTLKVKDIMITLEVIAQCLEDYNNKIDRAFT